MLACFLSNVDFTKTNFIRLDGDFVFAFWVLVAGKRKGFIRFQELLPTYSVVSIMYSIILANYPALNTILCLQTRFVATIFDGL
jgi:hypothetical protein